MSGKAKEPKGWVELNVEAFKRAVSSSHDDKEFKKKLDELTKIAQKPNP